MKTYTINVGESLEELDEAWSRCENLGYSTFEKQQAIADAIAEERQSHNDLRSLINQLEAIDGNGAPPVIGAAAQLIKRMWETAQNKELTKPKRESLLWAEIHPKRNTQNRESRDFLLRGVVDYLVGEDISVLNAPSHPSPVTCCEGQSGDAWL